MKKSDVNGDNTNEVYKWLKNEKSGILGLTRIKVKKTTSYSYRYRIIMTYQKIIIIRLLVEFWDVFGRQEWKSGESLGVFDNTRVYRWWYCQYDWVEFFFFSWIAAVVCMYVWVILSLELKASSITPPVTCFLTETPLYLARFWKISYFLPLPTSCDKPDLINWILQFAVRMPVLYYNHVTLSLKFSQLC